MSREWQQMTEILISLPACVNWFGDLSLLCALIRITSKMFTIKCETSRQEIENELKPILNES